MDLKVYIRLQRPDTINVQKRIDDTFGWTDPWATLIRWLTLIDTTTISCWNGLWLRSLPSQEEQTGS